MHHETAPCLLCMNTACGGFIISRRSPDGAMMTAGDSIDFTDLFAIIFTTCK